jgi:aryl-alcohol dehydrogenase-like predicted oxidoreductase
MIGETIKTAVAGGLEEGRRVTVDLIRSCGPWMLESSDACRPRDTGRDRPLSRRRRRRHRTLPAVAARAPVRRALQTDAQRALQFARSAPGITCALVGMKTPAHVEENAALARVDPLSIRNQT